MSRVVKFDEFGPPEVLHVVEEEIPGPDAGQVRVAIEGFGVNRLDLMVRAGNAPRPIGLPGARLGIEGTGTIDAVGDGVDGLAVGDAVLITAVPDMDTNGTYAEHVVVPANRVIARPSELDVVGAAALWVSYATAYGALVEKAGLRPADRVVITAASSGVGLASIEICNALGAIPIAVTRHAAKADVLRDAGAAKVIATDEEEVAEATHAFTDGTGAELIIDSIMGPGLADLAKAGKIGGALVTVGWLDPRPAPYPTAPLTMYRYMGFEHTLDDTVVRRMAAFLDAGVRNGTIRPTIDKVFGFDEVVDAHRHLEDGQQLGKVVVTV
jgi:NADPH:quinone reductase-like Zn-dependent oxidoreductase